MEYLTFCHSLNCEGKYAIYLLRMLNLQNTTCAKTQNTITRKFNQPNERHQYQPADISTHPTMISICTEIHNRAIEKYYFIVQRNS